MSLRIVAEAEFRLSWRNAKIAPKHGGKKTNIALRRPRMSVEEFLAWENRQDERWEFDGYEQPGHGGRQFAA